MDKWLPNVPTRLQWLSGSLDVPMWLTPKGDLQRLAYALGNSEGLAHRGSGIIAGYFRPSMSRTAYSTICLHVLDEKGASPTQCQRVCRVGKQLYGDAGELGA